MKHSGMLILQRYIAYMNTDLAEEPQQELETSDGTLLVPDLARLQKTLIHLLCEASEPIVVAIKGGWGEGKTYFWKNNVAKDIEPKSGYVSVFGVESLAEIRSQVVVEATAAWVNSDSTIGEMIRKHFPVLRGLGGIVSRVASKLWVSDVPSGVLPQIMEHVVFKPNWVICFDDIERLPKNIELDAVLGYANSLRDDRNLKVVLIYNDEKVDGAGRRDSLDRYLEKIVDRELAFAPNIAEIVRVVLESEIDDAETLEELVRRCNVLRLRNIRILKRAKLLYQEFVGVLPNDADPEFLKAVIYSLLLFSWVKFAPNDAGVITFEFLTDYSRLTATMKTSDDDVDNAPVKLLSEFGYEYTDDLDQMLMEFVRTSIPNFEGLRDEYEKYANNVSRGKLEATLHDVWQLHFHGTLKDTENMFGDRLIRATSDFLDYIPLYQMDSTLTMLSKLERNPDANRLLEEFMDRRPEIFEHYDPSSLASPIEFDDLRSKLESAARAASIDSRPIDEAIDSAIKDEFIGLADRERLAQFSAQEFVDHFTSVNEKHLTGKMRELAKMSRHAQDEREGKLYESITTAARIIADQSRLNRLRMEAMGLIAREQSDD